MSAEKQRVLVVEDDLSILTGVSMNLRFEGYEVLQAQDGERGLELAVAESPDLIVLDIMMPRINGYELLARAALPRRADAGAGALRQGAGAGQGARASTWVPTTTW